MVCLRRGSVAVSTSASAGSPVSSEDTLDVTEDTRLLLVSFALARAAPRFADTP
jgi:hypothetical protein